nr:hypothetical protein [Asgard group archaeon]
SQADAVIYVIDGTIKPTTQNDYFEVSKFSFDYMLTIVESKTPILILINKQDLIEEIPINTPESIKLYNISSLVGRSFNILPTSAKYGDGVETAILWLIDKIQERK